MGSGNHTLEYKLLSGKPTDEVNIQKFNKYFYDNIILMAPTVRSFGADVSIKDLLEFVDFHHNLMIFANNKSRKITRDLANEFGVDFEDIGYTLQGGQAPAQANQGGFKTRDVAWSSNLFEPLERVFTKLDRPVLIEDGLGSVIDSNKNNQHVFPILRADKGSYSFNADAEPRHETGLVSGEQLTVVAGYQTTYNQRIVLSGSLEMCSNKAMLANRDPKLQTIQSSPNFILCTEMVEWNLQERGVLRYDNVRHNKKGDTPDQNNNPENYKRQVDIEYYIDIYQKKGDQWVPFVADDVQFQFTMLDPYYQVALEQPDRNSPTFTYSLKTPWRLGIFRFHVDYKRYGLTYIDERMEVSVIQLRHDEFPRYETTGYPYYANVFVLMFSTFFFVLYFIASDFRNVKGVKSS